MLEQNNSDLFLFRVLHLVRWCSVCQHSGSPLTCRVSGRDLMPPFLMWEWLEWIGRKSQHAAQYSLTSPCSCSSCAWSSCEIEPGAAPSGSEARCRQSCQPQSATHGTSVWKSTKLTKPLVWKIALRCTATAPPLPCHQVHQDLTPPPTKPVSSLFKKYEGMQPEYHF